MHWIQFDLECGIYSITALLKSYIYRKRGTIRSTMYTQIISTYKNWQCKTPHTIYKHREEFIESYPPANILQSHCQYSFLTEMKFSSEHVYIIVIVYIESYPPANILPSHCQYSCLMAMKFSSRYVLCVLLNMTCNLYHDYRYIYFVLSCGHVSLLFHVKMHCIIIVWYYSLGIKSLQFFSVYWKPVNTVNET